MSKEKFTSPKGNLKWCIITGKGKETEKNSGKFKYQVVVKAHKDEPEVKEAMKHIDDFWAENKPKGSKPRPKTKAYKMEEDEDTGEETGYVYFGLSTPTTFGNSGDAKKIKVFTAKVPVREVDLGSKQIGEESTGRAMGVLAIYEFNGSFGSTLYLDAISLSTFVQYEGGGATAEDVVTDDDAEDIDLGESVVDTDSVSDEDEPRV